MKHLRLEPGGKIELDLLPKGKAALYAAKPDGKIEDFLGMLADRSKKVATIDEINEAIEEGWAGKR